MQSQISNLNRDLDVSEKKNNELSEKLIVLEKVQPIVLVAGRENLSLKTFLLFQFSFRACLEMKEQVLELKEIVKATKERGGAIGSMTPTGSLAGSPSLRSSTQLVIS